MKKLFVILLICLLLAGCSHPEEKLFNVSGSTYKISTSAEIGPGNGETNHFVLTSGEDTMEGAFISEEDYTNLQFDIGFDVDNEIYVRQPNEFIWTDYYGTTYICLRTDETCLILKSDAPYDRAVNMIVTLEKAKGEAEKVDLIDVYLVCEPDEGGVL